MDFKDTRKTLPKMMRMDSFEIWKKRFEFAIRILGGFWKLSGFNGGVLLVFLSSLVSGNSQGVALLFL